MTQADGHDVGPDKLCCHHINVRAYPGLEDVDAWCADEARAGFYYTSRVWNLDKLADSDEPEYYVTDLWVSDSDVAFEAKMRWA